jgi:uncharacterized protein
MNISMANPMIFVDTGPFLARYLVKDQFHQHAVNCWAELKKSSEKLVTSSFVLDETATLLGRRAGNIFAAERLNNIYASHAIQIWRPDRDDELRALEMFAKFSDQGVSFTDCVSFTLMSSRHVQQVFTFDRHFDSAGFKRLPR